MIKMYFSFSGRLNRLRYFLYSLPIIITGFALQLYEMSGGFITLAGSLFYLVVALIILVASFSLAVRRLHDMNYSGWFCLINLLNLFPVVKIVAFIFNLVLLFKRGTSGPNDYGKDPLLEDYQTYESPNYYGDL